jgi:hypothetical protein
MDSTDSQSKEQKETRIPGLEVCVLNVCFRIKAAAVPKKLCNWTWGGLPPVLPEAHSGGLRARVGAWPRRPGLTLIA